MFPIRPRIERLLASSITAVILGACDVPAPDTTPAPETPDAALASLDASSPDDAGYEDAGAPDTGGPPDAGPPPFAPGWRSIEGTPPTADRGRWGASLVPIEGEDRLLLVGGSTYPGGGAMNDVWSYSVQTGSWSELQTTHAPPPRFCHCATYLPTLREVLVVTGRDDRSPRPAEAFTLNLDTLDWTPVAGLMPAGLIGCHAVWMPTLDGGQAVIVGGDTRGGPTGRTYGYDPVIRSFTEIVTSSVPPGRRDGIAAYDPVSDKIYLHGGAASIYPTPAQRTDLWAFDGRQWTEVPTNEPPPGRRWATHALDPVRRIWVVFGGTIESSDRADLWVLHLDEARWESLALDGMPPGRGGAASSFSPSMDGMLVFGGLGQPSYRAFDDGWLLSFAGP